MSDIRVSRETRRLKILGDKAARKAASMIRAQVEMKQIDDADQLKAEIWNLYFWMEHHGVLSAPRRTKALLRAKYGYWKRVGVTGQIAA